jgi:hypothetical protein
LGIVRELAAARLIMLAEGLPLPCLNNAANPETIHFK